MKTIIAGSRDATREETFRAIEQSQFSELITEVLDGRQRTYDALAGKIIGGADYWGKVWAEEHGIPVRPFPADWKRYGKAAGPIRNNQMAENAEALIAVWKNRSRGTENMIDAAYRHNLLIAVIEV